jgi:hypothetical protein
MEATKDQTLSKESAIEQKMRPRNCSVLGFLGANERLGDVLKKDDETVKRLGLTHGKIAERIEYFIRAINGRPQREGKLVDGNYLVSGNSWRGGQECPWGDAGPFMRYSNLDLSIVNRTTGEKINLPGGIVHLITEHQFYEGEASPYRVDPEKAARVLDIG